MCGCIICASDVCIFVWVEYRYVCDVCMLKSVGERTPPRETPFFN